MSLSKDHRVEAEIQATCAFLGFTEPCSKKYTIEPDCLECLKDLVRFLKRDDDTCFVRRRLGKAAIVQKDLINIIKITGLNDRILFETVVRLSVNLTQPVHLCFGNHPPGDKIARQYMLEAQTYLQDYKEAFVDQDLFAVLANQLTELLKLDWESRHEEDKLLIERILLVVRNVLHVSSTNQQIELRADGDSSIHDQLIWSMHVSGLLDILLFIAANPDERQFSMYAIEIVSLIFKEQNVDQIASVGKVRPDAEKEKETKELRDLLENEKLAKLALSRKNSSRHSRFGGTFEVSNFKSITDRRLVTHRPLSVASDQSGLLAFERYKTARKKPTSRSKVCDLDETRRSAVGIRQVLKDFTTQFMQSCYNNVMRIAKDNLVRARTQENDESYYLRLVRFFTRANRLIDFQPHLVSETLTIPTFHYVLTQMERYLEMVETNKKEVRLWSERLHLALEAYHELLNYLVRMDRSKEEEDRENSKVIKSNIFYTMEYRDIILILLKKYDPTKQSKSYLRDLIETNHLFVRLLELFCRENVHLVVQKKKILAAGKGRGQRSTTGNVGGGEKDDSPEDDDREVERCWDEVSGQLSAIIQGRGDVVVEGPSVFDAASSTEQSQQRLNAIRRVQGHLRLNEPGRALGVLRSARDLWPDCNEFGAADVSAEEEFMLLRQMCFVKLPPDNRSSDDQLRRTAEEVEDEDRVPPEDRVPENHLLHRPGRTEEEEDPPSDSEEEVDREEFGDDRGTKTVEQHFSFKDFIFRFSHPSVVKSCVDCLEDFSKNSASVNRSVVKLLHRIAFDAQLTPMLFQARLFRVFRELLSGPVHSRGAGGDDLAELRRFATEILRRFFSAAEKNRKIFAELFFWKNVKESVEILEGYGGKVPSLSRKPFLWTEEQDEELKILYQEISSESNDFLDGKRDMVDMVMSRLIDRKKTRRQVIRQMVHLDLISSAKDVKQRTKTRDDVSRSRVHWLADEKETLRKIVSQHLDGDDPMAAIMSEYADFGGIRNKYQVTKKILAMGLVEDKKQLRRKRKAKKTKKRNINGGGGGGENADENIVEYRFPSVSSSEDEATTDRNDRNNPSSSSSDEDDRRSTDDAGTDDDRSEEGDEEVGQRLNLVGQSGEDEVGRLNLVGRRRRQSGEDEVGRLNLVGRRRQSGEDEVGRLNLVGQSSSGRGDRDDGINIDSLTTTARAKESGNNSGVRNNEGGGVAAVKKGTTSGVIDRRLRELIRKSNKDMSRVVEWLCVKLRRTADDREKDGDTYSIPLVAVTKEQEDAMASKKFQRLLLACGVKKPSTEQERFWRISAELSAERIRSAVEQLTEALASFKKNDDTPRATEKRNSVVAEVEQQIAVDGVKLRTGEGAAYGDVGEINIAASSSVGEEEKKTKSSSSFEKEREKNSPKLVGGRISSKLEELRLRRRKDGGKSGSAAARRRRGKGRFLYNTSDSSDEGVGGGITGVIDSATGPRKSHAIFIESETEDESNIATEKPSSSSSTTALFPVKSSRRIISDDDEEDKVEPPIRDGVAYTPGDGVTPLFDKVAPYSDLVAPPIRDGVANTPCDGVTPLSDKVAPSIDQVAPPPRDGVMPPSDKVAPSSDKVAHPTRDGRVTPPFDKVAPSSDQVAPPLRDEGVTPPSDNVAPFGDQLAHLDQDRLASLGQGEVAPFRNIVAPLGRDKVAPSEKAAPKFKRSLVVDSDDEAGIGDDAETAGNSASTKKRIKVVKSSDEDT